MPPDLTIVICTYNRAEFLPELLDSLAGQSVPASEFEVLIVDNNSSDDTARIAGEFCAGQANFRMVFEPVQGLSQARNRGWREAATPWVAYIDDDALAFPDFAERALDMARNHDFACFGGIYVPWYKFGRPRWYRDEYGSNVKLRPDVGPVDQGFVCGGVSCYRRDVLERIGGFDTGLGMSGDKCAYGEETGLQVRLRQAGYRIGFDPGFGIRHVVNRHKLSVGWFLRSGFAGGRNHWRAHGLRPGALLLAAVAAWMFVSALRNGVMALPRLARRDYYVQNWLIDTFSYPAYQAGKLVAGLSPDREPRP